MKRIIICCDGTWNNPEKEPVSNVVKVARALVPEADLPQVVFYDWGVGSEGGFEKLSGGAMGAGIDKNIQDAYRRGRLWSRSGLPESMLMSGAVTGRAGFLILHFYGWWSRRKRRV